MRIFKGLFEIFDLAKIYNLINIKYLIFWKLITGNRNDKKKLNDIL